MPAKHKLSWQPPKTLHEVCLYCSTSVTLAASQAVAMDMWTKDQMEMESVTIATLLENKCQWAFPHQKMFYLYKN